MCSRCVVVNPGSKIYDGSTDRLFEQYQKNKKITLSFDHPVQFPHMENGWRILENSPYKKVFEVPREKAGECLGALLNLSPVDVTIEEEEIGKIVERIYREGGEGNA